MKALLSSPDVEIHLGIAPSSCSELSLGPEELTYVSSYTSDSGEPALRIWRVAGGALLRLGYFDGTQFWLDQDGKQVWAIWNDPLKIEDAATYLLGPVLGLVLRLRGVTCLHASAVAFGGKAVAFVGSAGAGKSTTAAALLHRGHSVISDDIVALVENEEMFRVMPAYPYLCLWPDSVEQIYGSREALPPFTSNFEKRYLALGSDGPRFEDRPLIIGAIYVFGERSSSKASAEAMAPREALLNLVPNTYATNTIDKAMRAKEFEVLGRLVSRVPVRKLSPHQDAQHLDELCELIVRDLQSIGL